MLKTPIFYYMLCIKIGIDLSTVLHPFLSSISCPYNEFWMLLLNCGLGLSMAWFREFLNSIYSWMISISLWSILICNYFRETITWCLDNAFYIYWYIFKSDIPLEYIKRLVPILVLRKFFLVLRVWLNVIMSYREKRSKIKDLIKVCRNGKNQFSSSHWWHFLIKGGWLCSSTTQWNKTI
jgi:hypothetical protein